MSPRRCVWLSLLTLAVTSASALDRATIDVERVTLFKNGIALLSWRGEVPTEATELDLGVHGIPSLGSLVLSHGKGLEPKKLITSQDRRPAAPARRPTGPMADLAGIFAALEGEEITLLVQADEGPTQRLTGTLLQSGGEPAPVESSPYLMSPPRSDEMRLRVSGGGGYSFVLLETGEGVRAIRIDQILQVLFEADSFRPETGGGPAAPSLQLFLAKPAKGQRFGVHYLAKGMAWFPSFVFDLEDEDTLSVTMNAEIANELIDLEDVTLHLAIGTPTLEYADFESPLGGSRSLRELFEAIARGRTGDSYRSVGMAQQAAFDVGGAGSRPQGYSAGREGQLEDLYLFEVEDFSLPLDAAAWVVLKTATLPFQHVYRWEIEDLLDQKRGEFKEPQEESIWHSLRLRNDAEWPLTTAPALVRKAGQILAQTRTSYTAPGNDCLVRLTRALALPATQAEQEVQREALEERIWGTRYERITLEGRLAVRSELPRPARLEIEKLLTGTVESIDGEPRQVKLPRGLRDVNPKQRIDWRIELAPGEKIELGYRYSVLVRR